MKTKKNQIDLSGQNITINGNWYVLLKTDEPKHLPNIKPIFNIDCDLTTTKIGKNLK